MLQFRIWDGKISVMRSKSRPGSEFPRYAGIGDISLSADAPPEEMLAELSEAERAHVIETFEFWRRKRNEIEQADLAKLCALLTRARQHVERSRREDVEELGETLIYLCYELRQAVITKLGSD